MRTFVLLRPGFATVCDPEGKTVPWLWLNPAFAALAILISWANGAELSFSMAVLLLLAAAGIGAIIDRTS
jgi:lipoprotein signal peptidase